MPRVYLPAVFGPAFPCGLSPRAAAFADAWLALLGDRRKLMRCDDRLVKCAQLHAVYLDSRTGAQLQQSMHIGRNGSTANERVRASGYRLPDYFPQKGNTVESVARHWDTPAVVAVYLANHEGHREHLMGIGFYKASVVYGVGVAGRDFVALACPEEPN